MICRLEDGGWLIITQPAHAWLAGEMAAAWGNESFDRPSPMEAVVLATRLHDIGWLPWDAAPRLDDQGRPVNFLDTILAETMPMWYRAVGQVSLLDPFAALLVSKHASTIYRRRLARGADPIEKRAVLKAALEEQEKIQVSIQGKLADHPVYGPVVVQKKLHMAYRWLRVCDLISLILCADIMPDTGFIEKVPLKHDAGFTTLAYSRPEPFNVVLSPSPFADRSLKLRIETRHLDATNFPSQALYLDAIERAPWMSRRVSISAA